MGIYVYECNKCWRTAERILPVDQRDSAQTCDCGNLLTRVQAAAGFRLPGGNSKIDYEHAFNSDLYGKAEADAIKGGRE